MPPGQLPAYLVHRLQDGRELVQVYLSPADARQPVWLVGHCDERMWRRWAAGTGGWARLDGGELLVARGLGDIRLRLSVD